MTTDGFLYYLDEMLLKENKSWSKEINVNDWVFGEGLPNNCPTIKSSRFEAVNTELSNWKNDTKADSLKTTKWMTPEWLYFIGQLPDILSVKQMNELDEAFGLTVSGNAEIQAAWFEKVIPNNYAAAEDATDEFLIRVGRRKFLVPLYKAILKSEKGKVRAKAIYKKARPNYHSVSRTTIDGILGIN